MHMREIVACTGIGVAAGEDCAVPALVLFVIFAAVNSGKLII